MSIFCYIVPMNHVAWIEISRDNLLHNISEFRKILGASKKLCVVVKANAYGHGLKEVVSSIEDHVDYFQVDDFRELESIRTFTKQPVLVLGYMTPEESVIAFKKYDAVIGIFQNDPVRFAMLNDAAKESHKKVHAHVEIDALLGRLGTLSEDGEVFIDELKKYDQMVIDSLYAHFSDIEDSKNLDHAHAQCEQLRSVSESAGIPYHISATSGILSDPETNWGGAMMRLGIGLYGIWPSESLRTQWSDRLDLRPVLSWKTRVAQVKMLPAGYPVGYGQSFVTKTETKIAIIPQGYSDGYDRRFSNKGYVLINGEKCPIIGRVAMNMFVVDVTHLGKVSEGDEVVLIGKQHNAVISAKELAEKIGTIDYEVLARVSALLPRIIV